MQWQVTCECGWRTSGTREDVIANIQEHGRTVHNRELTSDEVMASAVPVD